MFIITTVVIIIIIIVIEIILFIKVTVTWIIQFYFEFFQLFSFIKDLYFPFSTIFPK